MLYSEMTSLNRWILISSTRRCTDWQEKFWSPKTFRWQKLGRKNSANTSSKLLPKNWPWTFPMKIRTTWSSLSRHSPSRFTTTSETNFPVPYFGKMSARWTNWKLEWKWRERFKTSWVLEPLSTSESDKTDSFTSANYETFLNFQLDKRSKSESLSLIFVGTESVWI